MLESSISRRGYPGLSVWAPNAATSVPVQTRREGSVTLEAGRRGRSHKPGSTGNRQRPGAPGPPPWSLCWVRGPAPPGSRFQSPELWENEFLLLETTGVGSLIMGMELISDTLACGRRFPGGEGRAWFTGSQPRQGQDPPTRSAPWHRHPATV